MEVIFLVILVLLVEYAGPITLGIPFVAAVEWISENIEISCCIFAVISLIVSGFALYSLSDDIFYNGLPGIIATIIIHIVLFILAGASGMFIISMILFSFGTIMTMGLCENDCYILGIHCLIASVALPIWLILH